MLTINSVLRLTSTRKASSRSSQRSETSSRNKPSTTGASRPLMATLPTYRQYLQSCKRAQQVLGTYSISTHAHLSAQLRKRYPSLSHMTSPIAAHHTKGLRLPTAKNTTATTRARIRTSWKARISASRMIGILMHDSPSSISAA
jgi:hypothetical protein